MRPFVAAAIKFTEGFIAISSLDCVTSLLAYEGQDTTLTPEDEAIHKETLAILSNALEVMNGSDEAAAQVEAWGIIKRTIR